MLDELLPHWDVRKVNDSAALARQADRWFPLSILMGTGETHHTPVSKPAIYQIGKPEIVTVFLTTKSVGYRQIGFFWTIIS